MGVKRDLSLEAANVLFSGFAFDKVEDTKDGISDTTYLAFKNKNCYVIKRYEYANILEIEAEKRLLSYLLKHNLKVPTILSVCKNDEKWRLFSCINGNSVNIATLIQISKIARFLSNMHRVTKNKKAIKKIFLVKHIKEELKIVRKKSIKMYYRFKEILKYTNENSDGIIHGDLFKDNAKFNENILCGVYDFIEAGEGSFVLDAGVTALSFATPSISKTDHFLRSYNTSSKKKITPEELDGAMKFAKLFYAMRRYNSGKLNYRELLSTSP